MSAPPAPAFDFEAVTFVFKKVHRRHFAWTLHLDRAMAPVRRAKAYNLLYVPQSRNGRENRRFAVINFIDPDVANLAVLMLRREGFELEPADLSQGMPAWFAIHTTLEASDEELLFLHEGVRVSREVAVRLYGGAPVTPTSPATPRSDGAAGSGAAPRIAW